MLINSLSVKNRECAATEFLNSCRRPCDLNAFRTVYKLNLFIQHFSEIMLNKLENEGTQALYTLLTYKY